MLKRSLFFIVGISITACGPKLLSPSTTSGDNNPNSEQEFVTVGVGVSQGNTNEFKLAAATAFTMSLDECSSGLTYASITEANTNIDVYKFDQNCLVKLENFTFGGITYIPTAANPFTTWATGDIATFIDQTDTVTGATIKVVVDAQLPSPIAGTESVGYSFSEIVAGSDESIADTVVGDSHGLSVAGQDAPNFKISGVQMTGMTANGAGIFKFFLECNVTATNSGATCDGLSNSLVTIALVADTYGGTIDLTQAAAIMAAGETSPSATIAVGDATYPNGGFESLDMTGPDQIHNNPNMLLVLEADNKSYLYFNLDVTTLAYP